MSQTDKSEQAVYRVTVHHYVSFNTDELDEDQTPEDFAKKNFDKGYEVDRDVESKVELA